VTPRIKGLERGTYRSSVQVSAPGVSPVEVPVKLTVRSHTTGLVGAWGFDETHGSTAKDASHPRNPGRISGAKRSQGRHGGALSFDGINDRVTIADAEALDGRHVTLEAWVRPRGGSRRAVFVKGRMHLLSPKLPRNRWSFVTITWDGTSASFAGPLRIGGAGGMWFSGRIDDVRVYNRALSAAEIRLDRDTPVR
jgi:hypothetical protein